MSQLPCLLPSSVMTPYTGGHTVTYGGYILELCPDHPKANMYGFVAQQRLVMERHMGRYLQAGEIVHHKNQNKIDNWPDNLQVCTRSEHQAIHQHLRRLAGTDRCPLSEQTVSEALRKAGSLSGAAQILKCHTQTLRNRFLDICTPYIRRRPTKIDDPVSIQKILDVAHNDKKGYREVAKETGISYRTVQRICERNGIAWKKKSRKGETHKTYRKKPIQNR